MTTATDDDLHGHAPSSFEEPAPMSEAYRDRAPEIEGRLDLIEQAIVRVVEALERLEKRLPERSA